jgi:hypothetical protein
LLTQKEHVTIPEKHVLKNGTLETIVGDRMARSVEKSLPSRRSVAVRRVERLSVASMGGCWKSVGLFLSRRPRPLHENIEDES